MRKLLLFFAMLCVSIGTWAQGTPVGNNDAWISTDTWFENVAAKKESVVKIKIQTPGSLAAALDQIDQSKYGVVYINLVEGSYLNDADIAALSDITVGTIDLQDAKYTADGTAFTFTNSTVRNLILPDGWSKTEVNNCATGLGSSNLNAAISQKVRTDGDAELVAYVNKYGTLRETMEHTFLDNKPNTKIGTGAGINKNNQAFDKIKYVSLMGNVAARDINGNVDYKYDANGHFEFDRPADETSWQKNAGVGGTRTLLGTSMVGALVGADLISLDLEDAIITEAYCDDLNLSMSGVIGESLKQVIFPTTPLLKTIPADCLYTSAKSLDELCIPRNIEIIRTRAFFLSDSNLRHIWTTGTDDPNDHTVYDNGAFVKSTGEKHLGHADLDDDIWNCKSTTARYGTYTLPPNLKLIESYAFNSDYTSDVYCLSVTAPECHVDAFSSIMYMGNNKIEGNAYQGMITRESYAQSSADGKYIAFLHYPRESTTPAIQRYTDVTREYSVATTLRDGKGNVIYFPNQSELNRAYYQGTTGYLWFAWNSERYPDTWGNANAFKNADPQGSPGHSDTNQTKANTFFEENTMTDPDKTDRSFYDVRLDASEQPTLTKPTDLKWYYNTIWEGKQLYPQAVSTTSPYVYVADGEGDYVLEVTETRDGETITNSLVFREYQGSADDKLQRFSRKQNIGYYGCSNGQFVQDYSWIKDDAGLYVLDGEYTLNTTGGGAYVENYTWGRDDTNGTHYNPLVSTPFPGDEWGNLPNGFNEYADYWYPTYKYDKDPNGEYVPVYGNGYFTESTVPSYWADEFQRQKAAGETYTREPLGYNQCTNNEEVKNHRTELFAVGDTYARWTPDVIDFVNGEKYARIPIVGEFREYNSSTDEGCDRYDITGNGFVLAVSPDDDTKQHYTKSYVANSYREFDSSRDKTDEPLYCYGESDYVSDTPITYTKQNDYRGWHQFILHAYATNDDRPLTPVKFYQTDNDWWTVCLPYDLKYTDMKKFFGNETTGAIPYLSKLRYVVRDYNREKITLMFSKNLMVYKEKITNPSITDDYVHGEIDDKTTWIGTGEGQYADEAALETADPIILHKGVPYLIKPNINVNASRSFDVFQTENEDLYNRLVAAQNVGGNALDTYIYKGEYTVPAYVIGESDEETVDSRTFSHTDFGPSFTYNSSDKIMYGGKEVQASISKDYSYTFVGSFFLSVLPQYCYFLGWDSNKNCAAFWYNRTPDLSSYTWSNQTGIICPNFNTSLLIDPATGLNDPARWRFSASDIGNDDLVGVASSAKKSLMDMDFGSIDVVVSGIGKINDDNAQNNVVNNDVIYDMRGVRMNRPLSRLTKGVYIVNGKKYVVD